MPLRLRRSSSVLTSALLSVQLCLLTPDSARAVAPSAEAAADARRSAAKAKFEQGVAAYGEQRYADAVQAFREADAIEPSAALSFNIARAYERLHDAPASLRWYRDYLRRAPSAPNAEEVRRRVAALAAVLAERGVQQLSVLSTPPGATLLRDDRVLGVTPFTGELAPGKYRFTLRLAGHREREVEVELPAGTPLDVTVALEPAPQPAASPPSPSSVPAREATRPTEPPFGVAPWILGGLGAATLIAAGGFELSRSSAESAAERAPQTEFQARVDEMERRQAAARVLVAVGGALLVTGGVLLVVNYQKRPAARVGLGCGAAGCAAFAVGSLP